MLRDAANTKAIQLKHAHRLYQPEQWHVVSCSVARWPGRHFNCMAVNSLRVFVAFCNSGLTVIQAIILTAEAQVQYLGSIYRICGDQGGTGMCVSPTTLLVFQ